MKDIIKHLTLVNYTKGSNRKIKYIVVHYTGNDNDTAYNNAKYFNIVNRNASAHYFVDSTSIYQVVEDTDIAWAVGVDYSNGTSSVRDCTNANSISVEMCNCLYDVPSEIENNTIELVKYLMKKYNIDVDHVIRHYDCCGKQCPLQYVKDESKWLNFKSKLEEVSTDYEIVKKRFGFADSTMKYLQAYEYSNDLLNKLANKD